MISTGRVERQALVEHLSTCAECRQKVEFDQWLGNALGQELTLPPQAMQRVREGAAMPRPNGFLSFLSTPQGAKTMKKTFLTSAAAAALILGISALLTSPAEASSAKAKFAAMKKALSSRQGVKIQLSNDGGGATKTVVYINGQLMDVKDGVPFEYQDGNKKIVISTATSKEALDKLPPEQRAEMQRLIDEAIKQAKAGNGTATTVSKKVIVNGKEVTGEEAARILKSTGFNMQTKTSKDGTGLELELNFDFNEGSYSAMKFGSNENTLLLTPRKGLNTRYSVVLDPRTNLPSTLTLQKASAGKWKDVKVSRFRFSIPLK